MATAEESILTVTKKLVNLPDEATEFDLDIIMHINAVFSTLRGLGIGPADGFYIVDKTKKWPEFVKYTNNINEVMSYMGIKVRLLFDPPSNSFTLKAMQDAAAEMEFRMMTSSEESRLPPIEPLILTREVDRDTAI